MNHHTIQLGVNVDHVATLRQARGVNYPSPLQAADIARQAGADIITVHLREDRRHIQDHDVYCIKKELAIPLNLEMAATSEMLTIALDVRPEEVCLVPEKREELTTEGGLDVMTQFVDLQETVEALSKAGIRVSLFIDPDEAQIAASKKLGVNMVELHTGTYAEAEGEAQARELTRLQNAVECAVASGLQVNAGHGLHYQNVVDISKIAQIDCLNIGHSIVSRAVISGFYEAVFAMKQLINGGRLETEGNRL